MPGAGMETEDRPGAAKPNTHPPKQRLRALGRDGAFQGAMHPEPSGWGQTRGPEALEQDRSF